MRSSGIYRSFRSKWSQTFFSVCTAMPKYFKIRILFTLFTFIRAQDPNNIFDVAEARNILSRKIGQWFAINFSGFSSTRTAFSKSVLLNTLLKPSWIYFTANHPAYRIIHALFIVGPPAFMNTFIVMVFPDKQYGCHLYVSPPTFPREVDLHDRTFAAYVYQHAACAVEVSR